MAKKLIEVDFKKVSTDQIENIRKLDKSRVKSLADSIEEKGLLEPPTILTEENGYFPVAIGYHRKEAWGLLYEKDPKKYAKMPAFQVEADAVEAQLLNFASNVNRKDMSPSEIASTAVYLRDDQNMDIGEIAKVIGMSRGRLVTLTKNWDKASKKVRAAWGQGKVASDTINEIVKDDDDEVQDKALAAALKELSGPDKNTHKAKKKAKAAAVKEVAKAAEKKKASPKSNKKKASTKKASGKAPTTGRPGKKKLVAAAKTILEAQSSKDYAHGVCNALLVAAGVEGFNLEDLIDKTCDGNFEMIDEIT